MVARRTVTTLALLIGTLGPVPRLEAQGMSEQSAREIVRALRDIRDELDSQQQFSEIAAIRDAQKQFLRSNAKFPDFIEVGTDVWLTVYDWHVRWRQPVSVGRDVANRYTLILLGTTVIMRTDMQPNYVGLPYDTR
jgi:hypothetical protein